MKETRTSYNYNYNLCYAFPICLSIHSGLRASAP